MVLDVPGAAGVHQSPVTTRSGIVGETETLVLAEPRPVPAEIDPRDVLWRYHDLDAPPARGRIMRAQPVSASEVAIVTHTAYWRELATVREDTTPPPPVLPLSDPVRIDRPSDGSAVTWRWPSSWTAAGVRAAIVQVYGAGTGGQSGQCLGSRRNGARGGATTIQQGAERWIVDGASEGGAPGGAGETTGMQGPGARGTSGARATLFLSPSVPTTFALGNGGTGAVAFPTAPAQGTEATLHGW